MQKCVIFVKKTKLTLKSPSITREIRSEFSFFNENDTFVDFLIDLLSVLNELNWFLIGKYWIVAAKNTGYLVLHNLCENCFCLKLVQNSLACVFGSKKTVFADSKSI